MHYTLHLTDRCNLACRYCYVRKGKSDMTADVARRVVDMACDGQHHGIIFFGGEPLLCMDTIRETVAWGKKNRSGGKGSFTTR